VEIVVTLLIGTLLDVLVATESGFAAGSTSSTMPGLDLTTSVFDTATSADTPPADEVGTELGARVDQDLTFGLGLAEPAALGPAAATLDCSSPDVILLEVEAIGDFTSSLECCTPGNVTATGFTLTPPVKVGLLTDSP